VEATIEQQAAELGRINIANGNRSTLRCSAQIHFTAKGKRKGSSEEKGPVEATRCDQACAFLTKPDKAIASQRVPIADGKAAVKWCDLSPRDTRQAWPHARPVTSPIADISCRAVLPEKANG
jgi:hypothetical protein